MLFIFLFYICQVATDDYDGIPLSSFNDPISSFLVRTYDGSTLSFTLTANGHSFKDQVHLFMQGNHIGYTQGTYNTLLVRVLEELRDYRKDLAELSININIILDDSRSIQFLIKSYESITVGVETLRSELKEYLGEDNPLIVEAAVADVIGQVKISF